MKSAMINLITGMDADFDKNSKEVEKEVDKIIAKTTTLEKVIEKVLQITHIKGSDSAFIINNDTFCSGYEYEIISEPHEPHYVILALTYLT
jgi:hypothetical protein